MAVTDLFGPAGPTTLSPGQERAIFLGEPRIQDGNIGRNAYWAVFVVPSPNHRPGFNVEVVRTWVEEYPGVAGVPRLRYLVRNNNPIEAVSFLRFAIRVSP